MGSIPDFFSIFSTYSSIDVAPIIIGGVGFFFAVLLFIISIAYSGSEDTNSDSNVSSNNRKIEHEEEDDLIDTEDEVKADISVDTKTDKVDGDEDDVEECNENENEDNDNSEEEIERFDRDDEEDDLIDTEDDTEENPEDINENIDNGDDGEEEEEEEEDDDEEDGEDEADEEEYEDDEDIDDEYFDDDDDDEDEEDDGIKLGDEQARVFNIMNNTSDNLFITGKAGTGKSVLLQHFVRHTSKQIAVVAPTGVAALNVGGQTIHSFFGLGLGVQDPSNPAMVRKMSQKKIEILKNLQTLVIDEVSMVRADIMDMVDAKLKYARKNNNPFGGCQIIAFGDLFQLPPVNADSEASRYIDDHYSTAYFFGISEIRKHPFKIIELQHVFRQKDAQFIDILNNIRLGKVNKEMLSIINKNCVVEPSNDDYITLTGDNATANAINRDKLKSLKKKEYTYSGNVTGDIKKSNMPTDLELHLKVGAHVMMVKNDHTESYGVKIRKTPRWVNGTLGIVSELTPTSIKVKINGVSHSINKETWEQYEYSYNEEEKVLEKEVVATFTQYPVRLAYAITIHKSQGQTYDAVKVNLSNGAFDSGQTYVALSRCRSMKTLYLEHPLRIKDIKVSQEVLTYMKDRTLEPSEKTEIYNIINVRQRSDNWLKMRQGKVTGTSAHYLKYYSVSYAIAKGMENDKENQYVSEAMQRGRDLEPIGIAKFAKEKRIKVDTAGFVESLIHKDAAFSPDGVIFGDDGKIKTIVEHKAFGAKHHYACYEKVDDKVMYQIQFGMFVTGAKDAYLVLYNPDLSDVKSRLLIKRIVRDSKIQNLFAERFSEYESGKKSLTSNSTRVWQSRGNARPVLQCNDAGKVLAEYSSAAEAASAVGIDAKGIWDVAHGNQKHAGGYVWKYKE